MQEKPLRIAIYTAIFGNKDDAPRLVNAEFDLRGDFDLICVTDNPDLKSDDYRMIPVQAQFSDVTKNARAVKINGFEGIADYDVAIWHDSSVRMDKAALPELAKFGTENMISAFHHRRCCIYLEAIGCIDQQKDSPIRITMQMFRYFLDGMPASDWFQETTIVVYQCRTYLKSELQTIWWNEVRNRSRRDQIALAYAKWKAKVKVQLLEGITGTGADNRFSVWVGHRYDHYVDDNILHKMNSYLIRGVCKKLIYEMRRRR